MSERYVCGMGFTSEEKPIRIIHDKVEDNDYYLFADLCKIMNEQQTTITALNEKIEQRNALLDKIEKALGETIEEWLLGVKYR